MCNDGVAEVFPISYLHPDNGRAVEILPQKVENTLREKGIQPHAIAEVVKRVTRIVFLLEPVRPNDVIVIERQPNEPLPKSEVRMHGRVLRGGQVMQTVDSYRPV